MDEPGYFYERVTPGFTLQVFAPGATSPHDLKKLGGDALVNLQCHASGVMFPFIDVENFLNYLGRELAELEQELGIEQKHRLALHRTMTALIDARDDIAAERAIKRLFPITQGGFVEEADGNLLLLSHLIFLDGILGMSIEEAFQGVHSLASKMQGMTAEAARHVSRQAVDGALATCAEVLGVESEAYRGAQTQLRQYLIPQGDTYLYATQACPTARKQVYHLLVKTISTALSRTREDSQQVRLLACAETLSHVGINRLLESAGHSLFCCRPPSGTNGEPHPIVAGAIRMMLRDNPYISAAEAYDTPLFSAASDDGYGFRTIAGGEHSNGLPETEMGKGSYAGLISRIAKGPTPEAKRNAFQFLKRMDWCPTLATHDSSLMASSAETLWEGVYAGRKLRQVIFDSLRPEHANAARVTGGFSKRELGIVLHNARTLDSLLRWRRDGTLKTFDGDQLSFSVNERLEERYDKDDFRGSLTAHDRHGRLLFTKSWQRRTSFPHMMRCLEVNNILSLTQLPVSKADSFAAFQAMSRPLTRYKNPLLANLNIAGFYLNKGKQISRKAYSGWIDRALRDKHNSEAMHRLMSYAHLADAEAISQSLLATLLLHHAERAGITVSSTYDTVSDFLEYYDPDDGISVHINGQECTLDRLGVSLLDSVQPVSINYLKLLDIADRLHHNIGPFKKLHAPKVDIEWEPCLATQAITRVAGRELTVRPLSSHRAIIEEGARQDHCLATYASQCAAGLYYAFAIELDGEPLATLGMDFSSGYLELDQIQGYRNRAIAEPYDTVIRAFGDALVAEQDNRAGADGVRYGFSATRFDGAQGDHALTPQELLTVELGLDYRSEACVEAVSKFLHSALPVKVIRERLEAVIDRVANQDADRRWRQVRQQIASHLLRQDSAAPLRWPDHVS